MVKSAFCVLFLLSTLALVGAENVFPERPLDESMRADFGAAVRVPSDVAAFSAVHDLDGLATDIWDSEPMQMLLRSPGAVMGFIQLQQHEGYQQYLRFRHDPMGREIMAALHQLIDREVFVAFGAEAAPRLIAATELMNEVYFTSMAAQFSAELRGEFAQSEPTGEMVRAVLARRADLLMPPMLIGSRLSQPERVQALIDQWLPAMLGQTPVGSYQQGEPGGAWFHRFVLTGGELLGQERERIIDRLLRQGVRPSEAADLMAWFAGLRLVLELTLRDDYLLLSIASDRGLLERWNGEDNLAASPHFRPLRALYRPGLVSLAYQSVDLAELTGWTPESIGELSQQVEALLAEQEQLPGELRERLQADIGPFFMDMAASVPPPAAMVACTYRERGLRSWRITTGVPRRLDGIGASRLHALAGAESLLAASGGARNDLGEYQVLARWLGTFFDYVRDFAPQAATDDREQVQALLDQVAVFGRTLDAALVEDLFPAFGPEVDSLLVVEGGGRIEGLPRELELGESLSVPRAALAVTLADREALLRGLDRIAAAVDTFGRELAAISQGEIPADFALPRPEAAPRDGLTLYGYPQQAIFGADLDPVAVVGDDRLVLSSSRSFALELAARGEGAGAVGRKPGEISRFLLDIGGWSSFGVGIASELIDAHLATRGRRQAQELVMVLTHLQILDRALQAFAGLSGNVTARDGYTVSETWLELASP